MWGRWGGGVKAKGKQLLIWKKTTLAARRRGSIIHFAQTRSIGPVDGVKRSQTVGGGQNERHLHPH